MKLKLRKKVFVINPVVTKNNDFFYDVIPSCSVALTEGVKLNEINLSGTKSKIYGNVIFLKGSYQK